MHTAFVQEQQQEQQESDEERAKRIAAQWIREESSDAPAEDVHQV